MTFSPQGATWSSFKMRIWSMTRKNILSLIAPILEDRADVMFGSRSRAAEVIVWFTFGIWWETGFSLCSPIC